MRLRVTNQTDEEVLDDREDIGRIVSETEQANKALLDIAGYVSVCVQLYCMLVSTVFHYMFWPTWPSSCV
jgi:hypothetical protein